MFVVADEMALRIGGERRFSRSAEAEEERRRAGFLVGRGRAMHREQAALRREIIRHRENAFLHLAGVFGAENDQFLVFEAEVDAGGRAHAGRQPVGRERARIVDDEIGLAEAGQFFARRADEHRVHEERVIGPRANDADLDAVFRIPAGEAVEAIKPLARVQIVKGALTVDLKRVLVARDIDRSPPDVALRCRDARPRACLLVSVPSWRRNRPRARRFRRCSRPSHNESHARRARWVGDCGRLRATVRPWTDRSSEECFAEFIFEMPDFLGLLHSHPLMSLPTQSLANMVHLLALQARGESASDKYL